METDKTRIEAIAKLLPARIGGPVAAACAGIAGQVTEFRLRALRPVCVGCAARTYFIEGEALSAAPGRAALCARDGELADALARLSEYSLYAKQAQLQGGYLTVRGGHRIGVAASMAADGGVDFGSVSGLNIRVAREVAGCADAVMRETQAGGPSSVLIVSPPGCGKTTMLRDLVRQSASPPFLRRVALIDERRELAALWNGAPALDAGLTTDILDGFSRRDGFAIALRCLAPEVIACDELSCAEDGALVADARRCGVHVFATIHAPDLSSLKSYPDFGRLRSAFGFAVLLRAGAAPGEIAGIERTDAL
ncbi:MAG: hypothetical protein VB021_07570 [Oscillospiraceae bacterium]|nr:hypothetical protein [Oscillospiraceae bacterium]